jgi:hypothetical protein
LKILTFFSKREQNREVLVQVSQHKYWLPKPNGVECPHSYNHTTIKCWDEVPHNRPTFEYLYHFFENYFVATEHQCNRTKDYCKE